MSINFSGAADVMKPEVGNDSLDTIIRQAVGKEPFLSLSRAGDNSVQWIQLLHALDRQGTSKFSSDFPGWPLLSPVKVQMQKCDKCSREFCSTINYRRHARLHRRSLNLDKDSAAKSRELLEAFWDKLSVDEAMETASFKDIMLEDVSGSVITKTLTSFIRKPGFSSLPPAYIKAGAALLDIVQGRPSRFPMSSQELFNILDEASEKTFLCAGTAESLQKYVFDGEAGKIGLEMRNLIACTSFLIEQKLVKAWIADKDAEALRCQKLLVEEEEAAQRRQAALLEKKRLKKLRQKEQKAKEQANVEALGSQEDVATVVECNPSSSPVSPRDIADSNLESADVTQDKLPSSSGVDQKLNVGEDGSIEPQSGSNSVCLESHNFQSADARMLPRNGRRHVVNSHWQLPKQQRSSNGLYSVQNHHGMKPGSKQKHASYRDTKTATVTNVNKMWTPKPRSETEEERHSCRIGNEKTNLPDQCGNCELLIGSIAVTLANCSSRHLGANHGQAPELCTSETGSHASKLNLAEKPGNRSTAKLWKRVSRHENGGTPAVGIRNKDSEEHEMASEASDQSLSTLNGDVNKSVLANEANAAEEDVRGQKFSSHVAKAFLAQRWKEAISSDHVKLVLVQEAEAPKFPVVQDDCQEVALSSKLNMPDHSVENCLVSSRAIETSATIKFRSKSEKVSKVYVPKQRCAA